MNRPDPYQRLQAQRRLRLAQARTGTPRAVAQRDGVGVQIDGRWLTAFCGDDYLGLAQQFGVVSALQDGAARLGAGTGGPPAAGGRLVLHEELEREVADWLGYPHALLFGNRYVADLAVVQALLGEPDDVCVQDRLNHPGLIDAARLAGCRLRRYPHLDAGGAMRQLRQSPEGAAMLVTEGVFGMDGDAAPLRALTLVARMQQALTCVDDAHGIGVAGPDGRGSVAAAGLGVEDVPLLLVSLGKALGASGAVVAGDEVLIGHLAETARPYLHAATLPPSQTAAALAAVRQARRDAWRRERLHERIVQFRAGAGRAGLTLMPSESPIQPLLGDEAAVVAMAAALERAGFLVSPIRPPAVPEGKARLRITLSALHTAEQVQALLDALARARDAAQAPSLASA